MSQSSLAMSGYAKGPCVKIIVGVREEQETYRIHWKLLQDVSGVIRSDLSSDDDVEGSREFRYTHHRARVFDLFIDWLYKGSLAPRSDSFRDTVKIIRLYILAYELECPRLQNWVVDYVMRYHQQHEIKPDELEVLFDYGPRESKLMKYLLKQWAYEYVKTDGNVVKVWHLFFRWYPRVLSQLLYAVRLISKPAAENPAYGDPKEWSVDELSGED